MEVSATRTMMQVEKLRAAPGKASARLSSEAWRLEVQRSVSSEFNKHRSFVLPSYALHRARPFASSNFTSTVAI